MIKLEYIAPYKTFGRPLTPEILEAIGIVTGYEPPGAGDALAAGPGEFDLWTTTTRQGVNYHQGLLEIVRERPPAANGGRRLRVRELRLGAEPNEQREHCIEAVVTCGRDALWRPRRWTYASWMRDPSGRVLEETRLLERAALDRRTLDRKWSGGRDTERLAGDEPLAFHWGLYEAVRRFPRRRGFAVTFDCLENLRKLKRDHRLVYAQARTATLHGRRVRLHCFTEWGEGIMPTEYWVDDASRLLLVVDANRVAVARALRPNGASPFHRPTWQVPHPKAPAAAPQRRARGRAERPNILFICTDQQHAQALSAAGNPHVRTPAMDSLWQKGVRFANAYCTNPICSPSRSSLFTGRMPSETGINRLNPHAVMRPGLPTIGDWLGRQAGYDCVYAGKWHVPLCHSYDIPGFRVLSTGQDHRGDISDVTVSHTCEAFLRSRRDGKPFLLVASIIQPHDVCDWLRLNLRHKRVPPIPLSRRELPPLPANFDALPPEPEYLRKYRVTGVEPNIGGWTETEWRWYLWNYYRMVEMADAEVGRILRALELAGLADNTVIAFTSDHGEGLGEHRLDRKNFHYEAAIRVPLIFTAPGRIRSDVTDTGTLASGIDLMPTFCAFAGVEPPPLTTARSLRPVLESGAALDRDEVVTEMSVRASGRSLRTPQYKYSVFRDDPVEQLFDLQADPGETANLAADPAWHAALVRHRQLLAGWERQLDPVADSPDGGVFRQPRA